MKQFLEAIEKNPELKAKMEALGKKPDAKPADFIALAKEYGFEITEKDFTSAAPEGKLSDDELDAVAGGALCICYVDGGGLGGEDFDNSYGKGKDLACACVIGGGGEWKDYEEGGKRKARCACVGIGYGSSSTD